MSPPLPRALLPFVTLFALAVFSPTVSAVPSLAAAALALSPDVRDAILGGDPVPVVLLSRGVPQWSTVSVGALAGMPLGSLSLGSTLRPLLDQSRGVIGATQLTQSTGLTGRGVVVAVVDTGVDVTHEDFRTPNGTTRIAWLLDYARSPSGLHPELEARYALTLDGTLAGAVYSAADLDAIPTAGDLPGDVIGHGTYVASIAAGNGRAHGGAVPAGTYVGIAPEATLVVVRAVSAGSARISDAAMVAGVSFALDRAAYLGMPVVVNLSEGSQMGTHDGDAPMERALAALAGDGTVPGRAVVVAAGNDGGRAIHARVDLAAGTTVTVPVTVPAGRAGGPADVVGITLAFDQPVTVSLRSPSGESTPAVSMGTAQGYLLADGEVSLANATDGRSPGTGALDAVILLAAGADTGRARTGGPWTIEVQGGGRVDGWVFEGSATFAAPYGGTDSTVAIPATTTAVVSVGALSTRTSWVNGRGMVFSSGGTDGAVAGFSGRGPDRLGVLRPDVLAPGDMVVAALSHQGRGVDGLLSDVSRWAADGEHAAGSGTSSAAPHVTGAMALLLQDSPTLTQSQLLAALAGSAHAATVSPHPRWNPAEAWGTLDLAGALAIVHGMSSTGDFVDVLASDVVTARTSVMVGESMQVACRLVDGSRSASIGPHAVSFGVTAGTVTDVRDIGGGRWVAEYTAGGTHPGDTVTLTVTVDGLALQPVNVRVSGTTSVPTTCDAAPWRRSPFGGSSVLWLSVFVRQRERSRRRRPRRGDPVRSLRLQG